MFDIDRVVRRMDHSPVLFDRMMDFFFVDCPASLGEIRQAVGADEWSTAVEAARDLRRCAADFGAVEVESAIAEVERCARVQDRTGSADGIERADFVIADLRDSLEPRCREHRRSPK